MSIPILKQPGQLAFHFECHPWSIRYYTASILCPSCKNTSALFRHEGNTVEKATEAIM